MMNTEGNNGNKPLGLWNVVSIGIGAMVGAGIFALLGQAALLMEASTWVAFAFGGIVAMFSGYAYARLGASYPSNGGIIDFFRRGLGNGVFSLALSLLYLLTLAVSIAMVARAFGAGGEQCQNGKHHPLPLPTQRHQPDHQAGNHRCHAAPQQITIAAQHLGCQQQPAETEPENMWMNDH